MTIQPQIPVGLTLLASGYERDGLMLDLYGASHPVDGIEVSDAALAGQRISVAALVTPEQMAQMGEWCEREARREAARQRKDDEIGRAYMAMMR